MRKKQGQREAGSLRARIFGALLTAFLAFSVTGAVIAGFWAWEFSDGWRQSARPLAYEVIISLERDASGELRIVPTDKLESWQTDHDDLWYLASDGLTTVRHGPAPATATAMTQGRALLDRGFEIIWQPDPSRGLAPRGAAIEHATIDGRPTVVVAGGLPPSVIGAGRQGLILSGVIGFLVNAMLFGLPTLVALWWVLSRETRLLKTAGEQVAGIGPRELATRIDVAAIPREIRPLAQGVNTALERLQAGFDRERMFASMAAHELRTPLAILTARLDGLADGPVKEALAADACAMGELVDDLLAFSHLAGRRNESDNVDLVQVTREAMAEMSLEAARAGVSLSYDGETQAHLAGDAQALRLMVRNLVGNAIRHGARGGSVFVSIEPGPVLVVEDDGPGIPPRLRQQVFEPFFRGADAAPGGSGLGLAVVREVADAHGAHVGVEDGTGGGACLVVRFPPAPTPMARPA